MSTLQGHSICISIGLLRRDHGEAGRSCAHIPACNPASAEATVLIGRADDNGPRDITGAVLTALARAKMAETGVSCVTTSLTPLTTTFPRER